MEVLKDSIVGSITGLQTSVSSWFNNLSQSITNKFNDLQTWFSDLKTNIGNWFSSLGDRISGFFIDLYNNIIDGLKSLFIPTIDIFPLIRFKFDGKFPIIGQVSGLFDGLYNFGSAEPHFVINYKGQTLKIIDFSMFADYMPAIRNLTAVFIWLAFLTKEVKRLPALLRGQNKE